MRSRCRVSMMMAIDHVNIQTVPSPPALGAFFSAVASNEGLDSGLGSQLSPCALHRKGWSTALQISPAGHTRPPCVPWIYTLLRYKAERRSATNSGSRPRTAWRDETGAEVLPPMGDKPKPAIKLLGLLAARPAGPRLALAHEIERHCSADEILQCRLIHLVALVDIDGAPDIPVEAGVE